MANLRTMALAQLLLASLTTAVPGAITGRSFISLPILRNVHVPDPASDTPSIAEALTSLDADASSPLPFDSPSSSLDTLLHQARSSSPSANLSDAVVSHLIPLGLGTPVQTVVPVLDTGSFELWVNPNCNYAPDPGLCGLTLPYNANASSTATILPDPDQTYSYAPGGRVQARVRFVNDTVRIGEAVMSSMRFGVAWTSIGVSTGIMGLGPNPNVTIGFSDKDGNGGVMAALVAAGVIESRAYGVVLGTSNVSYGLAGAITFGGLDKSRFTGPLFKIPVTPAEDAPEKTVRFWARVTSFGTIGPGASAANETTISIDTPHQDFLIDSGTTLSFMPGPVVQAISTLMGATTQTNGDVTVDCKWLDDPPEGGVVFHFATGSILMEWADLVIDLRAIIQGEGPGCYLAVTEAVGVPGIDSLPVLGRAFMKAAYSVFDLDNQVIYLAQGAHCGESDIVAIGAGPDAVPAVTGNCAHAGDDAPRLAPEPTPASEE